LWNKPAQESDFPYHKVEGARPYHASGQRVGNCYGFRISPPNRYCPKEKTPKPLFGLSPI